MCVSVCEKRESKRERAEERVCKCVSSCVYHPGRYERENAFQIILYILDEIFIFATLVSSSFQLRSSDSKSPHYSCPLLSILL